MFNPLIHVTMKENYFVSYETAENLLKLGYNEPCEYYYALVDSDKELMRSQKGEVANQELQDYILGYSAMSAPCILDVIEWLPKDDFKISVNKTEYCDKNQNYCSGYVCDVWYTPEHQLISYNGAPTMIDAIKGAIDEVAVYLCNKVIHLFECGDFYEAKGIQAELAARVLGITVTKRGEESVIGFPKYALLSYKSDLEDAGYKVVINEF